MAIYTYNDFEKAAQGAGLLGQFSSADLNLAKQNPDAGMSILKYKQDYKNATTDEARELANLGANGVRSSYGGYQGGGDGGQFYLDPLSPSSFDGGTAPTYTSKYGDQIDSMVADLLNREKFSYDQAADPAYSAYKKEYAREGKRATEDTLGQAAAMTGGMPSTAAMTAAQQAGDYYASKMADKVPELYQMAYERYLDDYNMDLSNLAAVQGAEQDNYARYLDELNQFNTDRAFNYGVLLDEIDSQTLGRQEAFDKAQLAAEFGDYAFLEDMGVNTENATKAEDFDRLYNLALLGAEYGDFSGFKALGYTDEQIAQMASKWNQVNLWS